MSAGRMLYYGIAGSAAVAIPWAVERVWILKACGATSPLECPRPKPWEVLRRGRSTMLPMPCHWGRLSRSQTDGRRPGSLLSPSWGGERSELLRARPRRENSSSGLPRFQNRSTTTPLFSRCPKWSAVVMNLPSASPAHVRVRTDG